MSTNFYWKDGLAVVRSTLVENTEDYAWNSVHVHIGKRAAAGLYCKDCETTLCTRGSRGIHYTNSENDWMKACPVCGAEWSAENLGKPNSGPISTVCSFTWTVLGHRKAMERLVEEGRGDEKLIVDEYGVEYTPKEFLTMMAEIPFHGQSPIEFC